MSKLFYKSTSILAVLLFAITYAFAQPTTTPAPPAPAAAPPTVDHSYKPLTLKLNDSGSKYVRLLMWHQIWATNTENNPGTVDVNGKALNGSSFDVAIRRSRFLAYAQISPRFLILTHWGINNQSFINGGSPNHTAGVTATAGNQGKKPQLFIHDAWTEYELVKDKLYLGAGLHYWNGVSRLSSNSTLNFMTLDAPIFNWSTIEATDQFARQFGIYAKGQLGRLDYRFAWNKPFVNGTAVAAMAPVAAASEVATNTLTEKSALQGYVNWMFWDKESNKLPFYVGSYNGAKKVLNVGAGFYSHPESSGSRTISGADTTSNLYGQTAIGADVYLDMPLKKEKGTFLSAYAVYYNMDFGKNYLRNVGILNEHGTTLASDPKKSWAGGGNAQPTIGTGSIIYAQVGYGLPKFKNGTQIQPYATVTNKNFDRIGEASTQFGLGLNYFIVSHHAKITVEYATRPVYTRDGTGPITRNGSKGQLIVQSHIFL